MINKHYLCNLPFSIFTGSLHTVPCFSEDMWLSILVVFFVSGVVSGDNITITGVDGNDCEMVERLSVAIRDIESPARRIGRYTDLESVYECYEMCCNQRLSGKILL